MEPYTPAPAADPFAAASDLYHGLVADLAAGPAAGLAHHELEELLDARGRELMRQLLQDHLDLRARREEEENTRARPAIVAAGDGSARSRLEYGHRRQVATVFGTVGVGRCAWRSPGAPNVHPMDAALALPRHRHSWGLAKMAVTEAITGSFDAAHTAIARRCGPVMGKRQLEQAVVAAAEDIDAFYAHRVAVPCTASTMLAISVDGKGIVMRPEALREATRKAAAAARGVFRTRLASGEKPARKRMATLACVYDAEPARRRPHDVIAPPGGRRADRRLRPGPKAQGKWLDASVADDPAEVIARAFDQAQARDPAHHRAWVVLVDGAHHQIELITAEAVRRGIGISIVVDFVHVLEYLWAAAWSFHHSGDPAAEDWVAVQALALLAGQGARVAAAIAAQAEGLAADRRGGAQRCVRYLRGHEEFLGYDRALEAGWPIATGVIEGACRHLISDRLDITGARWGLDGAEAVLKLRALRSNGDFEAYWRYHLAREHQRLYGIGGQEGYTLTA